jgi:hypothetical protein
MRIKTRLAILALLGASAAVVPAMAGTGVAQAALTPSAYTAAQAPVPIPGSVRVSTGPRTRVSPNITESPCNTRANSLSFFMHNSLGCVSFDGPGTADDLDLFNTFQVSAGIYSGSFLFLTGGGEHFLSFRQGDVIQFSGNVTVISVTIN